MRLTSKDQNKKRGWTLASRAIWCRLPWHQVTVNVPKTPDEYDHIILTLTRGNGSVSIDLTRLTEHELAAFRFAVLAATEVAEPTVKALDKKARESHDSGDDSDDRVYRGLPVVVVRRGALPLGAHSESVLDRYKDILQGLAGNVLPGGGSAEEGSPVDESFDGAGEGQEAGGDDSPSSEG